MRKAIITGVGKHLPEKELTNFDLEKMMDTSNDWIVERTGIEKRRFLGRHSGVTTSDLGVEAAKKALKNANLTAKDIDYIIFATLSPDYYFPGCAVLVQEKLGCGTIGALDIRNQCSGFVYAIATADAFIKSGQYKNILVIGAEIHSFGLDMTTRSRNVSVIFGDGAGAVIVSATEEKERGILATNVHSEGKYAEDLAQLFPGTKYGWPDTVLEIGHKIDAEKMYPKMNGNYVFKHAITRFPESIKEAFKDAGEKVENLKLFIPHQANLRISQAVQKKLKLSDNQIFNNIQKYGNTTAASIPIALAEVCEQGLIQKGDLICMSAFGSGFTWGSILMRW